MLTSCSQNSEGNDTVNTLDKGQSLKDWNVNKKFKCSDGTTIEGYLVGDGACDCGEDCGDEL